MSSPTLHKIATVWMTFLAFRAIELQAIIADGMDDVPPRHPLYAWYHRYATADIRPTWRSLRNPNPRYNITSRGVPCLDDSSSANPCLQFASWKRLPPAAAEFHAAAPWETLRRSRTLSGSIYIEV